MSSYIHKPLKHSNSIRVFKLYPSYAEDEPIQESLSSYRLSDSDLHYEALSYAWGSTSDPVVIYVGQSQQKLVVSRKCYDALLRLRRSKTPRSIWVDAVCVNQQDTQERTRQVRLMNQIYAKAFRTIVHLGEPTRGSEMLFDELDQAASAPMQHLSPHGFSMPGRPQPSPQVFQQLHELVERPWFHRLWVVQEAFASKSLHFMCGSREAPHSLLMDCFQGFTDDSFSADSRLTVPLALNTRNLYPKSDNVWKNLWYWLCKTRPLMAVDARDKVFALKALLGSKQEKMDAIIDYEKPLASVLVETADCLLSTVGPRVLTAVHRPHGLSMSSWVPDWSDASGDVAAYANVKSTGFKPEWFSVKGGVLNVQCWEMGDVSSIGSSFDLRSVSDILSHSDKFFLIKGCPAPCLLRKVDSRTWYLISGQCITVQPVNGADPSEYYLDSVDRWRMLQERWGKPSTLSIR